MSKDIVIIKTDGNPTNAMAQAQAESYLANLIDANWVANLKQSLNDVTNDRGKATGQYQYDGEPVLHASSGNSQKSVTLFYFDRDDVHYVIAMGEHLDSNSYKLVDYGQPDGDFKSGRSIRLN